MKRICALVLAAVLLLGLAACGGGGSGSSDPNVGKWAAVSVSMMGMDMEVAELFEGGVGLELKANGKFTIDVDGEKGSGKWAYAGSALKLTASGVDMTATVADGMLMLTNLLGMGIDIAFEKEGGYTPAAGAAPGSTAAGNTGAHSGAPPNATDNETPPAKLNTLQAWWNGNWYGYIYLPTADGAWETLEDGVWDCFGTIDSDAAGDGSIYLWDDGGELANVRLHITEYGVSDAGVAMSAGGRFNEMEIAQADWIIDPGTNTQPYEHLIIIDGAFEDPDGSEYGGFMYEIWLRPWGMLWDDADIEDRPPGYADWYLDRCTGPMPSMSELLSGADPQPAADDGQAGGSADMTTLDFEAFTVGYPAGTEFEDDWLNGRMIKDGGGKFEISFSQQNSEERVATVREEMAAYLSDSEAKGATEFSRPLGGISDVYCVKYDSIIWNEAMLSVAFPQEINGYYGMQLCIKAKDTQYKIDDVLALPQVQAILDSVAFKNG